ncbi:MAG: PQQ-binding-like beta-propeller repeat protein [Verrucomicrobiota bacterium]
MKTLLTVVFAFAFALATSADAAVKGWLAWRGPAQNGTSTEKGLPDKLDPAKPLWAKDFSGASTPVIANGKLYIMGYAGEGTDLQEFIACFDAETGKELWRHGFNDFLSDIIYTRYATSNPAVDPETGNVYMQGTQGILAAFTPDGKMLWHVSMMEEYGRLTFPNGRTATPVIDGDLVITRGITGNWGAHGPVGDRLYAFDKKTGELVWASSPADRPKDSSYSYPYLGWLDGKRVLYVTTGDGSVCCINARTGEPLWRVPLGKAGINATVVVHKDSTVVAIYGTPYEPGQMVAFSVPKVAPKPGEPGPIVVERNQVELWSLDISTSTSSPILVGDTVYVVAEKGDFHAVDIKTGKILWNPPVKIGIEQRNSCPLYADGKLYVPILDDPGSKTEAGSEAGTKGGFFIIKPSPTKGDIIDHAALDGRCFGSPTAYNGKIYIQTTKKLYCFGKAGNNPGLVDAPAEKWPKPGPATQLQIIPAEVALTPGQVASFRVRKLDANGLVVEDVKDVSTVKWASYIPPTARVKSTMKGSFNAQGQLVAAKDPIASAGAFEATLGNLKGYIRGRVLRNLPFTEDFEAFQLTEKTTNDVEEATAFAYPPLPWIGARFKFEVREQGGSKVLTKTIENKLFQRGTIFFGRPDMKNYTIEAEVMTEGDRRKKSEIGVICQRYAVILKGNDNKLEINSNLDRLRVPEGTAPPNFTIAAKTWYHLKARVDVANDGSGVIRAKAWKKGEPEPSAWTLEVKHKNAHQSGSPGLFSFSPQDIRAHIDNVKVTAN